MRKKTIVLAVEEPFLNPWTRLMVDIHINGELRRCRMAVKLCNDQLFSYAYENHCR